VESEQVLVVEWGPQQTIKGGNKDPVGRVASELLERCATYHGKDCSRRRTNPSGLHSRPYVGSREG
jgi:hypothetical protein